MCSSPASRLVLQGCNRQAEGRITIGVEHLSNAGSLGKRRPFSFRMRLMVCCTFLDLYQSKVSKAIDANQVHTATLHLRVFLINSSLVGKSFGASYGINKSLSVQEVGGLFIIIVL